jgi:vitellogenic carboxypeptidase-like protein
LIFEHPLSVTLSFVKDARHLPQNARQGNRQLYQALLNFLARHPEVASNPIILAGESYAGTYLPLLAEAILEGNEARGGTYL